MLVDKCPHVALANNSSSSQKGTAIEWNNLLKLTQRNYLLKHSDSIRSNIPWQVAITWVAQQLPGKTSLIQNTVVAAESLRLPTRFLSGTKREELGKRMSKVATDFHNLYSSPHFVTKVTSQKMRLERGWGWEMCDEEKNNAQAYPVLVKTAKKRDHLHGLDKDGILKLI